MDEIVIGRPGRRESVGLVQEAADGDADHCVSAGVFVGRDVKRVIVASASWGAIPFCMPPHRRCAQSEATHRAFYGEMDCFIACAPLRKRFAFVAGNDGEGAAATPPTSKPWEELANSQPGAPFKSMSPASPPSSGHARRDCRLRYVR
jgi:hypothetical protein